MDIFQIDKLILFVLFFIPGFVSIKIWHLFIPSDKLSGTDYVLEAVSYSCINFAILFFPIRYLVELSEKYQELILIGCGLIYFLVGPSLWPILAKKSLELSWIEKYVIHPIPKAWDYFFGTRKPCFMLIHMKNGDMIGGYYAEGSFASSYPADEDIYLRYLWRIDEDGQFLEQVENSRGILISKDSIDTIELFDLPNNLEEEVTDE